MHPPPPRSGTGLGESDLLSGLGVREEDTQRVSCEHADRCGGCPVIALPYGEQLGLKRGRVVQSVSRYPALELVYTEPVQPAEPISEYRTRAKLIVAPGGKLGLYAKGGGHQVVDIPRCKVVSPVVAEVAAALRARIVHDEAAGGPLAPFDPSGPGALRAVDLREVRPGDGADARVLVTLVVQRDRVADRGPVEAAARALADDDPRIAGVALNFHEGESPQILGSETAVVHGAASVPDRIGLATHEATYGSFVQAHRGQAERVHTTVIDLLGLGRARQSKPGPTRVLDLYGGSGAIALALAHAGADVHLVESFAPAVGHVDEAARKAKLPVRAEAADVASALRRFAEQSAEFDAAVVNPPRRGMSPLARELLVRLEVPVVAYVSCDPDTLARDLDHFTRLGYGVTTLRPLDMIPLTDEVETIALLRRSGSATPKVMWEDEEILVVDKGAHEPTTQQGEYASSLVTRARKLPGASEAVPVHRIDVGTSGLVMLAKRPDVAAKWQAVLSAETARKIYVAGARGVTPSKGAITRDLREDGKMYPARTRYRRLAVASGHSVLRVVPEQGRTHQIRRHLAAIGHPILGDDRYGHAPTNRFFEEKNALDRTFLHCVRLEFMHPRTQQRLIIEAPMPGDLRAVLERTSGPGTLRFLDHKNALGQSGVSSLPPPPDSHHDTGHILDIDSSTPTIRPEMVTDDDG
ncbi:MAG: RsmD family RNA methyltransferase [Labilithrix sp.]|nr:RsmD family RNA methyltransferase [Labilithrix sp.]